MKNKLGVEKTDGIDYILEYLPYEKISTILDVGCGDCYATYKFYEKNKKITALGLNIEDYGVQKNDLREKSIEIIEDNFFTYNFDEQKFDAVWASHIMEHTTNPGLFLDKIKSILNSNGYAIISVPPYKSNLVGGHLSTGWTLGQLAYFLLFCGFDIKNGQFVKFGYNLTAIVKVADFKLPDINYDKGDLEILAKYFPEELNIAQGVEGDVYSINWPHKIPKKERRRRWRSLKGDSLQCLKKTYRNFRELRKKRS